MAAGKVGAGIEQMCLAAGAAAPQANLVFALTADQRLEAGDNEFGLGAYEIVKTILAVEREG